MHDRILPQHQDHDEYRPHEIRRNSLRASIRSTVAAIPNNSGKIRRGKWTIEEERITERIIKEFFGHQLTDCEEDWSLRTYLAIKLNSSKMRISKKLAHRCIGSAVYGHVHGNGECGGGAVPSDRSQIKFRGRNARTKSYGNRTSLYQQMYGNEADVAGEEDEKEENENKDDAAIRQLHDDTDNNNNLTGATVFPLSSFFAPVMIPVTTRAPVMDSTPVLAVTSVNTVPAIVNYTMPNSPFSSSSSYMTNDTVPVGTASPTGISACGTVSPASSLRIRLDLCSAPNPNPIQQESPAARPCTGDVLVAYCTKLKSIPVFTTPGGTGNTATPHMFVTTHPAATITTTTETTETTETITATKATDLNFTSMHADYRHALEQQQLLQESQLLQSYPWSFEVGTGTEIEIETEAVDAQIGETEIEVYIT